MNPTRTHGSDPSSKRSIRSALFKTLAAATLTLPVAIAQGHLSNRWGPQTELARTVLAMEQLPDHLGDWSVVSQAAPLSPHVCRTLKLAGHLHRVYEQAESGRRVTLLLLVGPGGPLVRHPPELCYESLDNRLLDSQTMTVTNGGREYHFRLLKYAAAPSRAQDFAVAYSFGCRQQWDVPEMPRLAYGGEAVLLKLQILINGRHAGSASEPTALADFLQQLLPAINQLTASPTATRHRTAGGRKQTVATFAMRIF